MASRALQISRKEEIMSNFQIKKILDSIDQDQSAQNVQFHLGGALTPTSPQTIGRFNLKYCYIH